MAQKLSQKDLAAQLYREGKLSVQQIAERVGMSRATIYNWIQAEGLSGQRRGGAAQPSDELTAVVEGVREMRASLHEANWPKVVEALDTISAEMIDLHRLREANTVQVDEIKTEVLELRRCVIDLRTEVARLIGAVELLTTIQRGQHDHADGNGD